jgi:hypothetical protein
VVQFAVDGGGEVVPAGFELGEALGFDLAGRVGVRWIADDYDLCSDECG